MFVLNFFLAVSLLNYYYFLFCSSAWVTEESITPYGKLREKYLNSSRQTKPFKEALEAIESIWQSLPVSTPTLF
jgi:hypothetical protein